jgi:hypothetical protein
MPTLHWGHLIAQTMQVDSGLNRSVHAQLCSQPKIPAQDKRVSHDL